MTYKVSIGKNEDQKVLSEIDGEVYTSPEEVKNILTSRATRTIEKMVMLAEKNANELYSENVKTEIHNHLQEEYKVSSNDINSLSTENTGENSDLMMQLPDGRFAKVNVKSTGNFS